MFSVVFLNLLLVRSDACDTVLEDELKATKAYAKVEHDGREGETFEVGNGVTNFMKSFDEVLLNF